MDSPKKLIGLSGVVILNLALQFIFQWYVIVSFGAGRQTDAFFGAAALPQFILAVLSGSLTMVLVPMLSRRDGEGFLQDAWDYFQSVGLLFSGIAIVLLATSSWWVALVLPGFKGADAQLVLNLARIELVGMVASALLSVLWAVHSAKSNFVFIETTSIVANIIAFVLLFFTIKKFGIYMATCITVLQVLLQVLFLMKIMRPYKKLQLKSTSLKEGWKKLRPLVAGNAYYKTDTLVDRYLTSNGAAGELTLLNLAQQLYTVGNSILIKVLVNTMVPSLSKASADGDEKKYNRLLKMRLLVSFLCTTIFFVVIILFGKWVFAAIFSFKKFGIRDVAKLWWLLLLLGGFWVSGLLGGVTSGAFYAKGDTVTPTKISVIAFSIFIPIKVFCYFKFGIEGLCISISIYYLMTLLVHLFYLRNHLK